MPPRGGCYDVAVEVRAQWVRISVAHVERLAPALRAAVANQLAPGTLAAIDDVSPFEWLPVERLLAIDEAIVAVTGIDEYGAVARSMLANDVGQTLVGPLLGAAARATRLGPAGLFRVVPAAYRLVTRGCGRLRVEAGADHVLIEWTEVPARLHGSEPYVVGIAKSLEGMLGFFGREGAVWSSPGLVDTF